MNKNTELVLKMMQRRAEAELANLRAEHGADYVPDRRLGKTFVNRYGIVINADTGESVGLSDRTPGVVVLTDAQFRYALESLVKAGLVYRSFFRNVREGVAYFVNTEADKARDEARQAAYDANVAAEARVVAELKARGIKVSSQSGCVSIGAADLLALLKM